MKIKTPFLNQRSGVLYFYNLQLNGDELKTAILLPLKSYRIWDAGKIRQVLRPPNCRKLHYGKREVPHGSSLSRAAIDDSISLFACGVGGFTGRSGYQVAT